MHKNSTRADSKGLQARLASLPPPGITAAEVNAWLATLPEPQTNDATQPAKGDS